jgi:hypothetical protein
MIRLMAVATVLLFSSAAIRAQDRPAPSSRPAMVPLKVTIVLSRYEGDKKISSLPYTLFVTANDAEFTRLRMGTQVPVPTTVITQAKDSTTPPVQSYNYRDVGTNIDCRAVSEGDSYKLLLTVADSAVYFPDKSEALVTNRSMTGAPAFRNFNSTVSVMLRDGQTVQYTSVADPVSGQTIKLDATLNVLK